MSLDWLKYQEADGLEEETPETEDRRFHRLTEGMSRSDILLLLIEQQCLKYPGSYWFPPMNGYDLLYIGRESVSVPVGGAGDAAALRSLERRGLIAKPYPTQFDHPTKYSYYITDGGKLRAQEIA